MIDYNQLAQAGNFLNSLSTIGTPSLVQHHDIVTVNGYQEAKEFKLNKNERVAMIDANDDILYVKECDSVGKYVLKVYECHDVTDSYMKRNTPAVISREEFERMSVDLAEVKKMLEDRNGKHNVKKEPEQHSPAVPELFPADKK